MAMNSGANIAKVDTPITPETCAVDPGSSHVGRNADKVRQTNHFTHPLIEAEDVGVTGANAGMSVAGEHGNKGRSR